MTAVTPINEGFIIEVEQEVLGALLTGGDLRRVSAILSPEHFLEDIHRRLYGLMVTAHQRYNSTSVPVVAKLIPEDLALGFQSKLNTSAAGYLAKLAAETVLGPTALEQSARKVVEQWARVTLASEAGRLQAAANDPASDPSELVSRAGQAFDDIVSAVRKGPRRKTRMSLAEASDNALSAAREARQRGSGLTGITWGLVDVNRLTGGLQPRDLTLIAARPSMGKTTLGLSVALKAAKMGVGIGFISLEMDGDKLAARAMTDLAYDWQVHIPYADLIRGNVDDKALEALEAASRDRDKLPLIIEEQPGLSMTDIRIKVDAMMEAAEKRGNPLRVLFIDHLGLIKPSSRYQGNRTNEVAEITAGAKQLAREYGIAVALLSQLNRALESRDDKRPQLSDLRDSGAIEQDADTIIFLYREAYYLDREKAKSADEDIERTQRLIECQNKLEFIIAKQRNGPIATVDLFADMACAAIRNGVRR
jgi:replicative DNA helicase